MKKLIIALLLVGTASFAQPQDEKRSNRDHKEKMTPEQRNQLQLKKMTLDLGLNESQQKEMAKIIADRTARREAFMAEKKANKEKGIKLSADQQFAKKNQILDERIKTKARIKKILNAEQFEKWERHNEKMEAKTKRKMYKKSERKKEQGLEQK